MTMCTWCGDKYETTMWTNHNCLPNKEDVENVRTKSNQVMSGWDECKEPNCDRCHCEECN